MCSAVLALSLAGTFAHADEVLNFGQLIADRGAVGACAGTLANTGRIQAKGVATDAGGNIVMTAQANIILTADSTLDASGEQDGGSIAITSNDGGVYAGGEISLRGEAGAGGNATISGEMVLLAAQIDARGASHGGNVVVRGDLHGNGGGCQGNHNRHDGRCRH
ncbi:MAG: hypothetical protein ACI9DC_002117 [Gammaproteobacteria bacterium]